MGLKLPAPLQGARQGFLPNRDMVREQGERPEVNGRLQVLDSIIHPNSDEHIKKNILVEGRCRRGWKEMFAFLLWNWEHVLGDHIFLMERGIGNAIRGLAVKMRHLRFVIYDVQRCPVEESRWPIPQFHFGNWFILWGWLETTLLDDPNIRPGMDDNASFDRG